jgi:hypothetical protein
MSNPPDLISKQLPRRSWIYWFLLVCVCVAVSPARANIDLEFRPQQQTVLVGEAVALGLYAVSDNDMTNQSFAAIQAIFQWDPGHLRLLGLDETGSVDLLSSGFTANDPFGLNEVVPPQDGDGLYLALAFLGDPIDATPQGTLITTFQFEALSLAEETLVGLLPTGGDPPGETIVFDGTVPNLDVTGELRGATVQIVIPVPSTLMLLAVCGWLTPAGHRRRRRACGPRLSTG